jgi:Fic family protein
MPEQKGYENSHPWLTFSANVSELSYELWAKLGECQSKCEHVRDVPILPDTRKKLTRLYLAKGIHATTAIEGNPLTEQEVLGLLDGELKLPESREYQAREVENVVKICNDILGIIQRGSTPPLDVESIKTLNRRILNGLITVEDHVTPGELREVSVTVLRYLGAPAKDCEYLLGRLCIWLNSSYFDAPHSSMVFVFAIIKAVIAHLYIAWIHPFGDGNGRTARLLEFIILISSGIPATAAHLLSDHYNRTRTRYYIELDKASKSKPTGNIIPFLEYAIQGLLDGLKEQVNAIQKQHREVVWRDYVSNAVRGKSIGVKTRRQTLVFVISAETTSMSIGEITELPRLVRAYPNLKSTALRHDIDELVQEGLLVREKGKIMANFEAISGFKNITAV